MFTLIALINYYTRDLHGSALMPQDILNLGTAAEVMGSYTLKITQDVVKIVLLYLPILAIVFVQAQLVKGAPKRAGWKARGVRAAAGALGVFLVMFFGYFGPRDHQTQDDLRLGVAEHLLHLRLSGPGRLRPPA